MGEQVRNKVNKALDFLVLAIWGTFEQFNPTILKLEEFVGQIGSQFVVNLLYQTVVLVRHFLQKEKSTMYHAMLCAL